MTLSILKTAEMQNWTASPHDIDMFPNWDAHPLFGNFTRALYPQVDKLANNHQDVSFAIMNDSDVHLLASCTLSNDGISLYGLPAVLAPRADLGAKQRKKAIAFALDHMCELVQGAAKGSVQVLGGSNACSPNDIDDACIGRLASPHLRIHALVDLDGGEEAIHKTIRKSFRSLINWGRDNLTMTYVNTANAERRQLDAYAEFHTQVAGGHAYPNSYWDVFWAEIMSGRGELSLGHLKDGTLVAGTFTTMAGGTAYYVSGVYDRDQFDKPLSHFPVFDAMVRAAERGAVRYDLGEIVPKADAPSPKEAQIGFFKKGFAQRCELTTAWTLSIT